MPYKHLEHEADIGVVGIGDSLEEAFAEGAKGMFEVMVDISGVSAEKSVPLTCKAPDIPTLFVEFLNELITLRDVEEMFFSEFKVKIEKKDSGYSLKATAFGEEISEENHEIKTEVKAATYSGLKYWEENGKFNVQCVVDI